jgi:hypothetical protein
VWVDVVESVAIAPNPLVIKYARGSPPLRRQVRVVNRMGRQAIVTPVKYDHDLLQVESTQQTGSIAGFDVLPIELPGSALDTQVEFDVEGSERQTLAVRFEPRMP